MLCIMVIILAQCHAFAAKSLANRRGQLLILVHTHEQVDLRHFRHQILLVPLGKATGNDQQLALAGFLILRHFQNGVNGFFLCRADEPAGVHHQNIRLCRIAGKSVPIFLQNTQGCFTVNTVFVASQ